MRLSIYLLHNQKNKNGALKNFLLDKYDGNPITQKSLYKPDIPGFRKGLFFYQEFTKKKPEWITKVNDVLYKPLTNNYENDDIRAVLVLKINRRHFALSFNSGISMVKSEFIDYNFGFNVARKILDEKKIASYYSTDFSEKIINTKKNSNSFIPTHVLNDRKNLSIVNSISGNGAGDIQSRVVGKYSLVVDFKGNLKTDLIPYLTKLSNTYIDKNKKGISVLNNLSQVKEKEILDHLNNCLFEDILKWSEYLKVKENKNSLPLHYLENIFLNTNYDLDEEIFSGYSIDGLGYKSEKIFDVINKYDYFERFCNQIKKNSKEINKDYVLNKLKRDAIYANFKNSSEKKKISNVYNSIVVTYSLPKGDIERKGILISGKWFYISKNYYYDLETEINRYKNKFQDIKLSSYKKIDTGEGSYNVRMSEKYNLSLLDKNTYPYPKDMKKVGFKSHSRIEPCDLLKYNSEENKLIMWHIKRGVSAAGISHLTTQAEASAALLFDKEQRKDFINFINTEDATLNIPTNIKPENITIILGITKKKPENSIRNIFSLLELTSLKRCLTVLYSQGFNVSLELISDRT